MKTCSKCKQEKELSEFYIDKSSGKPYHYCKQCVLQEKKDYYLKHKEHILAIDKKNYKEKSEQKKLYRINWYKKPENAEKAKRASKNWYFKNKSRARENNRKWLHKHKEERNRYDYEKKYGITYEEREQILVNQNRKCKICKKLLINSKDCHTDHNHKTGKIRGMLCGNCNLLLGNAFENIEILKEAIKYLESFI